MEAFKKKLSHSLGILDPVTKLKGKLGNLLQKKPFISDSKCKLHFQKMSVLNKLFLIYGALECLKRA